MRWTPPKGFSVYDKIHPYSPEINDKCVAPGTKTDIFETDFGKVGILSNHPPTFRDVRTFDIAENIGLLCADLDLNRSVSPHYHGGTMLEVPGGKRNRADQLLYLDDIY
ncbi:MAG: hypothetical protein LBJ01_11565 [Tannerella sp.]|jgi:hypothetical protein|nr:hypothetical protein [Tannerella sp.]